MERKFSIKNRLFAMVLAIFFILPTILTGCDLFAGIGESGGDDENNPPPEVVTPTLTVVADEQLVYSEENSRYEITLAQGESYALKVSLGDYTGDGYSVIYAWNSSGTQYVTMDSDDLITISKDAPTYANPTLTIKLQKNGSSSVIESKKIYFTITERAPVTLVSKSSEVQVIKSTKYGVDYEIKVPLAYRFYQLPTVLVDGVDEYEVVYQKADDEFSSELIEFKLEESASQFRILDEFDFLFPVEFYILIKDKSGELIKKLTCTAVETLESDEVLEVFYGNEMTQIRQNETIYIEKTDKNAVPIRFYFNGTEVLSGEASYTLENSNADIEVKKGSSDIGWGWQIKSLGIVADSVITITYTRDTPIVEEEIKQFVFKFNVSVCDQKELLGLIVPLGEEAFTIVGNSVYVNGKIYAQYSVGGLEAINGSDDLSITVTDTADENIKTVTLCYEYKGVTKERSFAVEVNKSGQFAKTDITQNYQKYWQNNGYTATAFEGEAKVLAIPVWFADSNEFISTDETIKDRNGKTQREQIIEDLRVALFGKNEDLTFRSLRAYYLEESLGRLKISGKVTPWYETTAKSTDYGDKDTAITRLTEDAVKWYFDESGTTETRADYDANNDGKIDHIIMFYGANYHCFRNGVAMVSGWCRKVGNSTDSYIARSSYSWISAMSLYGVDGLSPSVYSQLTKTDLSMIHGIKAKTIIHEFAHAIGIDDLYDISHKNEPSGWFNMQSGNSGGHDPYSVMAMGWADPYVFDSSDDSLSNEITITINDFQSSGDVILLTPRWDDEMQIFDEYILLELFTPTGLNKYDASFRIPNVVGIRLWHVNATINSDTDEHYNTNNALEGNYDLVHFIRNDPTCEYRSLTSLDRQEYLFDEGDQFDMDTFKSQFYNADGKLDNGTSLGWAFEVTDITTDEFGNATATVKITKTA